MKKIFKPSIVVIAILIGFIILDTAQALIFNNNTLLGIETHCMKRKGILVDTYHCGNGKNITRFKKNNLCYTEDICSANLEVKTDQQLELEIKDNFKKILQTNKSSSSTYDYIQNDYYKRIIKLGRRAVPILVNLYEEGYFSENGLDANISMIAIEEITGCNIKEKYHLIYTIPEEFYSLWKDYNCELYSKDKEVSILLKRNTLSSTGATFIIKNNTDKDYSYGPEYRIEKEENKEWQELDTLTGNPLTWNTIISSLKGKEEKEIIIDWSLGYGELKKGNYRLVKSIYQDNLKKINVNTEFRIH